MDSNAPRRYYVAGSAPGDFSRAASGFFALIALTTLLLSPRLLTLVVAGPLLAVATYGFVTRSRPGVFVECAEDGVVFNVVWANRVPFEDILRAERPIVRYGTIRRALENIAVKWGSLFGGNLDEIPPHGRPFLNTVDVVFRRRLWMIRPTPPFLFGKSMFRVYSLPDADAFIEDINARLANDTRASTPLP